jgi:hypothetical protein
MDRDAAVAGALFLGFVGTISLTVGIAILFGAGWAFVAFGGITLVNAWLMGVRKSRSNETLLFANTNN